MHVLAALPGLACHALLHLLVIGTLVCVAVSVVLRSPVLNRQSQARPRARYVVAVAGFVAAAVLPLLVQGVGILNGSGTEGLSHTSLSNTSVSSEQWRMPGRSAEQPLRPSADGLEVWWLRFSIGPWSRFLVLAWGIGTLTLMAGSALGGWRFGKLRRCWAEAPDDLRRSLEFPADVPLLSGPGGAPLATGLWRPRVFLPSWTLTDLEPAALKRIVRHELAHVRWRDPLVDRAVRVVRGLLWPAWPLWPLARRVRREREAAADREALAPETVDRASKREVIAYAETLLAVAARRSGLLPLVGAAGELEDRVRRLLQPAGRASATARALTAVLLAAGVVALAAHPLPTGGVALLDVPQSGEDVPAWGPLDHFLGFNPRIEHVIAPGVHRLKIQGHELDAEQMDRWRRAVSLEERAAIVQEADALARGTPPPG